MTVAAGSRVGPYEALEPLGAGGMGEVHRARDPRLGRDVVVKLVATEGVPSADRLRRFAIDARAAAQIAHPNVVTVHDVGTHDGVPYLVLVLSRNPRGVIGVASATGGEPHLLLRYPGSGPLVVSPDGQWIASGGGNGTIRLWPMPDLSKPPLHTLPHDELLAKLYAATNLRAVRDPASPTGWKIEADPVAGWEELPEW